VEPRATDTDPSVLVVNSVTDESTHVVTLRPELWAGSVDGEVMSDWFWRAVTEPDTIQSRVEAVENCGDLFEACLGNV